jgi:hypothetical protein
MLDKLNGTAGVYNTQNYDVHAIYPSSTTYYLLPSLTPSQL